MRDSGRGPVHHKQSVLKMEISSLCHGRLERERERERKKDRKNLDSSCYSLLYIYCVFTFMELYSSNVIVSSNLCRYHDRHLKQSQRYYYYYT